MTEHYFISASKQPRLSHSQYLQQRRLRASRFLQQSAKTEHETSCQQPVCDTLRRDDGRSDVARPVPPSPGMDRDPSATIESSTVQLSQEIVDKDTSRVSYAAPQDSVDQGAHTASEEDTAMPVVSVAIFPAHTNFNTKICTGAHAARCDIQRRSVAMRTAVQWVRASVARVFLIARG